MIQNCSTCENFNETMPGPLCMNCVDGVFYKGKEDNPIHPKHYGILDGQYEAIDVITDRLKTLSAKYKNPYTVSFYYGNVLKYLLRWTTKNGLEDLKKARFYLDRMISDME